MKSAEPRFYRIAALMGDPTRARMLAILLGGEYRTAGELATAANITAQAASTQLAQLIDGGLLTARTQGRYKYFAIADAEVGHALEVLSLIAQRDRVSARWDSPTQRHLKCARRCYGHLAGGLGVAQYQMLIERKFLGAQSAGLALTAAGQAWLSKIGVAAPMTAAHRFAYPCMDWSERKDHLAGALAKSLLDLYLAKSWVKPIPSSRALTITSIGSVALKNALGIDIKALE